MVNIASLSPYLSSHVSKGHRVAAEEPVIDADLGPNFYMRSIRFCGIPWVLPEIYALVRQQMTDLEELPKTWDAWHNNMCEVQIRLREQMVVPIRALLPSNFLDWCIKEKLTPAREARNRYAAMVARQAVASIGDDDVNYATEKPDVFAFSVTDPINACEKCGGLIYRVRLN